MPYEEEPMIRQRTQDKLQSLLNNHHRKISDDVWQRMDAHQRVEELTGHSLDNCRAILDLPLEMAVMSPTSLFIVGCPAVLH